MALLNARAGAIQRNPNGNISEAVVAAFERRGIAAEAKLLHGSDLSAAAEAAVQQARAGKIDAIVVGGGDGTIGTVAAAAVDTKIPLGVLPLGTLNHFARDLGIPLDLEGAVAVIAAATCRAVDVADVNGRIFLNNSSIAYTPIWCWSGTSAGSSKVSFDPRQIKASELTALIAALQPKGSG